MTESVNSPATQPIQDKAPKPPGLMPKNVQTWAMLGLAVLMVSIMWLTGGKKPQTLPRSGTSTVQTPAPLEVNEGKIAELQNRIQELQREQQVAVAGWIIRPQRQRLAIAAFGFRVPGLHL